MMLLLCFIGFRGLKCSTVEKTIQWQDVDASKSAYFRDPGDLVDLSDGLDDDIHALVVSRKLGGRRLFEKNGLLWSILTDALKLDDWSKMTLSIGDSSEDIINSSL